jgi:hypothetical protein
MPAAPARKRHIVPKRIRRQRIAVAVHDEKIGDLHRGPYAGRVVTTTFEPASLSVSLITYTFITTFFASHKISPKAGFVFGSLRGGFCHLLWVVVEVGCDLRRRKVEQFVKPFAEANR